MKDDENLRERVVALEALVRTLLDVLERSGAISRADRARMQGAGDANDEVARERPGLTYDRGSPYRSGSPGPTTRMAVCARCGRELEDDDPDLSLGAGRVCTACFSRGA